MILERTEDEILIRLPLETDENDLKRFIDFFKYKELTKNSKATQNDANELAKAANRSMMKKIIKDRKIN